MKRLKLTVDLELADDVERDQVDELLGAVMAQLEDDEPGALTSFRMHAACPGWNAPAG